MARPLADARDGILWRACIRLPLLGPLLWASNERHSLGASPADPAGSSSLSPRFFRSPRTGLLVHHRRWAPAGGAAPRGVVYLLHGFGDHCARYESYAAPLAAAGYEVCGLDAQGHGASEGDAGYFAAFSHLVEDVLHFARHVRPAPLGAPRYLVGHSMGGLLALHAALAAPHGFFRALAITAPALTIDPKVDTPLNRLLVRLLSAALPKLEVQPLPLEGLSADPALIAQYSRDPLVYHGKIRVRVGGELLAAIASALSRARELALPLLVQHGDADPRCALSGSRALLAAAGCEDKELRVWPGQRHECVLLRGARGDRFALSPLSPRAGAPP